MGASTADAAEPKAFSIKLQHCALSSLAWATVQRLLPSLEQGGALQAPEENNQLRCLNCKSLPKSLLFLNLAGNELASLRDLQLPNLLWLDASHNQLEELPDMGQLPALLEAEFSHNKLTNLDGVERATRLQTLLVDGNAVSSFMQLRVLSMCSNLHSLSILDNPLPPTLLSKKGHVALRNILPGLTMLNGLRLPGPHAPYTMVWQLAQMGAFPGAATLKSHVPPSDAGDHEHGESCARAQFCGVMPPGRLRPKRGSMPKDCQSANCITQADVRVG
ncbi:hypothetical protein WJX73_000380 [Symbiochloris irregularis]|uniref:Uncharacterized protein n=1 Tax=Symbiochloris irregularis TaxID=706552 RepID=A0AAW1PM39_9CHLO